MKESFIITIFMGMALMFGLTKEYIQDNGKKIKCMDQGR